MSDGLTTKGNMMNNTNTTTNYAAVTKTTKRFLSAGIIASEIDSAQREERAIIQAQGAGRTGEDTIDRACRAAVAARRNGRKVVEAVYVGREVFCALYPHADWRVVARAARAIDSAVGVKGVK